MLIAVMFGALFDPRAAWAVTNVFFNNSQTTNLVSSGTTSDTISSEGYLFTFTRDKLFTGGVGMTNPIGRYVRIPWPQGLEAQAVTSGPNPGGARMVIKRQDGLTFAITSFTAKLLANTAGAGGAIEIMPLLNGQDGAANPFAYDVSGYYGNNFTFPTPELTGFDTYDVTLYVDYALMSLTVVDASLPPPGLAVVRANATTLHLSWPTNASGYALETATNFPAQAWSPVTNRAAVNGDTFTVEMQPNAPRRFYRLRK
jgi:hypothetical protein